MNETKTWVNPIEKFLKDRFECNEKGDAFKWHVIANNMFGYYEQYCKDHSETSLRVIDFNKCLAAIPGVRRTSIGVKISVSDIRTTFKWKTVRVWEGLRKNNTSGIITEKDLEVNNELV